MKRNHYSYTTYADPETARTFDARRFGGPIGDLVAGTQARVLANLIGTIRNRVILDVGTGTGRAALALARRGGVVTGVDASREMLEVAARRAREAHVPLTLVPGDAHALDFADRSFDAVVCLRVLMHTPDWQRSLRELCRVSAHLLVFDYPARWSTAAVQAAWRQVVRTFDRRTEAYRVFSARAIAHALEREGFRVVGEHRQFVLPIALHKRVGSASWTRRVEAALDRAGLLRRFGSPVTVAAERCGS